MRENSSACYVGLYGFDYIYIAADVYFSADMDAKPLTLPVLNGLRMTEAKPIRINVF